MANIIAWFAGKKTYFIVILGFLLALVAFASGDMTLLEFIQDPAFLSLLALFGIGTVKMGIKRDAKK